VVPENQAVFECIQERQSLLYKSMDDIYKRDGRLGNKK
jgi:hypothetical protein